MPNESNVILPDVKNEGSTKIPSSEKQNKFKRFITAISVIFLFAVIIGFTCLNYMLHINDYEDKFLSSASEEALINCVKPILIKGELSLSQDEINELISYEIRENAADFISDNGIIINSAAIDFEGDNELSLYVKYTKKSTFVLKADIALSFDNINQEICLNVKKISIGHVSLPDFLNNKFLSKINTGKKLIIEGNNIILPINLNRNSDKNYLLKINTLTVDKNELKITTNKLFEKEMQIFNKILGAKSDDMLSTVIDTIISTSKNYTAENVLSSCVDEIISRFVEN